MPVEQDKVFLEHPKGSSALILLYGATVVSWKSATIREPEPMERLFVSSKAALDGSKPVRGGIPVVFPCFGAPTHSEHAKLGQHGFGRSEIWQWDGVVMANGSGVSVKLTLEPSTKITTVYNKPFHLSYVVTLAEHQLSTTIHVKNTSTSTTFPLDNFEFQALFHNYIRAPSDQVLVSPLRGLTYYDKTEVTEQGRSTSKTETRAGVDVRKFTDYVYENAPGNYKVTWPGGGIAIKTTNLNHVVIWNPQENGSKMTDMEDDGWKRFICVEPGHVREFVNLEPGKTWIAQQVLSVIHEGGD